MRRPRAPAPAGIWSASVYSWAGAPYIPQCILVYSGIWNVHSTLGRCILSVFLVHSWTVLNILVNILGIYSDNIYPDNNPPLILRKRPRRPDLRGCALSDTWRYSSGLDGRSSQHDPRRRGRLPCTGPTRHLNPHGDTTTTTSIDRVPKTVGRIPGSTLPSAIATDGASTSLPVCQS